MSPLPVTLEDVQRAAARIAGAVVHTPCLRSETLSRIAKADIWIKFENLQFTASFKERGALNTLLQLNAAERKRRWSVRDDIQWGQCNPHLAPQIANVVESFCAVELYLPDYVRNAMSVWRPSRACAWFYANWGYEESKHSLALGDWLLRSRART